MSKNATRYDKTNLYKHDIDPLVQEVAQKCEDAQIPYFFSAAVANNEEETEYANRANGAVAEGITLTDDQITKHINVAAGFAVILPESIPEIEL